MQTRGEGRARETRDALCAVQSFQAYVNVDCDATLRRHAHSARPYTFPDDVSTRSREGASERAVKAGGDSYFRLAAASRGVGDSYALLSFHGIRCRNEIAVSLVT